MFKFFPTKSKPSGISLLVTILILASVLAAIVGLSVLIINELKLSRNVNHAILAYFAAETGIEKGLYNIQQDRISGEKLESIIFNLLQNDIGMDNGSLWSTSAVKGDTDFFASEIPQDQSVQFSLFDPDDFSEPAGDGNGNGVEKIDISWSIPSSSSSETTLEITSVQLKQSTGESCDKVKKKIYSYMSNALYNFYDDPTVICYLANDDIFQVRAKALYGTIYNFSFSPIDSNGGDPLEGYGSAIVMKSVGQYSQSRQAIQITVPWQLAASGFLDYVIFAEEPLIKL